MPALIRSGGGVFAKELRAGALSVLTLITSDRGGGLDETLEKVLLLLGGDEAGCGEI